MESPTGKTILSGIQPSGTLHIGNYLGALKQWVALQKDNTAYYCIVDEHAITVEYDPQELPGRTLNAAAIYLAAGIDPKKSTVFVQSHIPAHTELAWLLETITPLGQLERMTQFKEKSLGNIKKQFDNLESYEFSQFYEKELAGIKAFGEISGNQDIIAFVENQLEARKETLLGLLAYPVLMAADILLYKTDLVPVGEDQKQHIELTRDIAEKFNNRFRSKTFEIPAAYTPEQSARVMSLVDPTRKMSKSDGEKSYIALTDEPEVIRKKVMSAVTDTEPVFKFDNGGTPAEASAKAGPAVKNLLRIYQAFSEESPETIEQKFSGKGYKEFKEALADLMVEKLMPIREKYTELRKDEKHLKNILEQGREKAAAVANKTLQSVKEKMGLL